MLYFYLNMAIYGINKMKKMLVVLSMAMLLVACGNDGEATKEVSVKNPETIGAIVMGKASAAAVDASKADADIDQKNSETESLTAIDSGSVLTSNKMLDNSVMQEGKAIDMPPDLVADIMTQQALNESISRLGEALVSLEQAASRTKEAATALKQRAAE